MLRAFEAVARHQSVTQAAAELHVTQGAVSHQVKALEQWLDAKLVQRDGRRIALTPAGAAYAPSLGTALDLMADATRRLQRRARRERMTVSTFSTLATYWLVPRLGDFCAAYPDVDVDISTDYPRADFDPASYDVSIRCYTMDELQTQLRRRDWRGVQAGRFLGESLSLVCSPQLATPERPLAVLTDVARHPMLESRSIPTAWPDWLQAAGLAAEHQPRTHITFDHTHLALNAALAGAGMALAPTPLLGPLLQEGSLVQPFPQIAVGPKDNYWVRAPRTLGNAAVSAFCAWLTAQGRDEPVAPAR
ncbi:MAG: LysR family transcriptional regulator [Burkholderiales bacterium]|nr:LysR family transcriptional regulator [Burkholderiales bacterium]